MALFIVDDTGDELWRIDDPASPADAVDVGDLPAGLTAPRGIASYGGVLYCVDNTGDELWIINTTTPADSTLVGTLPALLESPGGLAFHDGNLYCVDITTDELWRIDTVTPGNSVRIGQFPSELATPDGAASHNGVLYCCDSSDSQLWIVDTADPSSSTLVGSFPTGIVWPNGLASEGGVLYCVDNNGDDLWTVDTTTPANSTLAGALPAGLTTPRGLTSHTAGTGGTTTITVELGADQMVRGDLDYVLPATVTIEHPVGVPVYLWERTSGIDTEPLNDTGSLHPVLHTPDVGGTSSFTVFRLTVTNNGVTASDTIRLNYFPHLRAPSYTPPSAPMQTWMVGTAVNITIPTPNGNPPPLVSADLPPGLGFQGNTVINGVPLAGGSGTIVVTATNSEGAATYTIPYVINPITLSGMLGGAGGVLAGSLALVGPAALAFSGSLAGAGGMLSGSILTGERASLAAQIAFRQQPNLGIDIAERENLLLPQYADAARFHALVREFIGILQDEVVDPLLAMSHGLNHVGSEGVLLDWLGARLGLPRPRVAASDATFFGFAGTMAAGGRTFGQAPFFTRARGIESQEPIGDATYRPLLAARARRLRGGADRETMEAVLAVIWPNGNGYLDETTTPMTLRVTAPDDLVWSLVSGTEREKLIPRPAGRALTMVRS